MYILWRNLRPTTHPLTLIPPVVPAFRPQIILAVAVFHDHVTVLKILGLLVAIQGSILYKVARGKPGSRTGEGRAGKDDG